jgi:hypothetical protein
VAFSPQANYTDWPTATGRQILVSTFVVWGVSHGERDGTPTAVNISFLDRRNYFFLTGNSSFMIKRLSGPRFWPFATQKML